MSPIPRPHPEHLRRVCADKAAYRADKAAYAVLANKLHGPSSPQHEVDSRIADDVVPNQKHEERCG
jgi:hypothetical protein